MPRDVNASDRASMDNFHGDRPNVIATNPAHPSRSSFPYPRTAVEAEAGAASERDDAQVGNQLKVADVGRSHCVAELQGTGPDQQIR